MSTITIPKVYADFQTSLASSISSTATTLTLKDSTDPDGTTFSGYYLLTIDRGNSSKEYMLVTLAGASGTIARRKLSKVDLYTEVSANAFPHYRGAKVEITTVSSLVINRLLNGDDSFNSVNWTGVSSISGLSVPTSSETTKAAPVAYVNSISAAGSVDSSTAAKGVGKSTYAHNKSLGTATITIASPAVVTLTSHGLIAGDQVLFTTSGALPTGITASTNYYVISAGLTSDNFEISATSGGSAINTSGSQSGTHTLYRMTPFFVSDTDPRMPTSGQTAALVGDNTDIAVGSGNKYVTQTGLQKQAENFVSLTGTNTMTGTLSPAPTSYSSGMTVKAKIGTTNTGAVTWNFNGLGAIAVKKLDGTVALVANDLVANQVVTGVYDSGLNAFVLQNPTGTAGTNIASGSFSYSMGTGSGMAGVALSFTPTKSGKVLILMIGDVSHDTATGTGIVSVRYGTGSAPATNAALTGTVGGTSINFSRPTGTVFKVPFTVGGYVTGLTINTAYWLDLGLTAGGGTATVADAIINVVEL